MYKDFGMDIFTKRLHSTNKDDMTNRTTLQYHDQRYIILHMIIKNTHGIKILSFNEKKLIDHYTYL